MAAMAPSEEAVTTWALIDRETGRLLRVTPEIAAPFMV